MVKNPRNLGAYCIIKVSLVLRSTHVVPRNQDRRVFYINNYIEWDQFNQLYDANLFNKDIRNTNVVARKLELASIKTTNLKLKVAKKKGSNKVRSKRETENNGSSHKMIEG